MIKIFKYKTFFTFIMCSILIMLQILIVNSDSTSGREYDRLSSQIINLQYENALLSQQVASSSSMITIAEKAKLLGFDSQKSLVSLYGPQPLAALKEKLE